MRSQTSLLQVEPEPPASHAGPTHKNNIFYLELISDWYLQDTISQACNPSEEQKSCFLWPSTILFSVNEFKEIKHTNHILH